MRRMIALLAFFALAAASSVFAQTGTTTWTANPLPMVQANDLSAGFPENPVAFSQTSITTGNASTTSVAVSPLVGRKRIKFRLNAAGELWVSIGTTTAVVSGANCVKIARGTVSTPTVELQVAEETFEYDANVPMGHIASTAFSITILQEGRRMGQR